MSRVPKRSHASTAASTLASTKRAHESALFTPMSHDYCMSEEEFAEFLSEYGGGYTETDFARVKRNHESHKRIKRELLEVSVGEIDHSTLSPHQLLYVKLGGEPNAFDQVRHHYDLVIEAFKRDPIGLGVVLMHGDEMAEMCCTMVHYNGGFEFKVANKDINPTKERLIEFARKATSITKLAANFLIWMADEASGLVYEGGTWYSTNPFTSNGAETLEGEGVLL